MSEKSTPPDAASFPLREHGRGYDEFSVGQVFHHHWGRTVTETDAILFATQTLAWNPIHFNVEAARARGHQGLVVSPYLVLAIAVGLSVEDLSERSEAFLGLDRVEFAAPVAIGDTLEAESTVEATRRSASNPQHGIVTWHTECRNQHGTVVLRFARANLFRLEAGDAPD